MTAERKALSVERIPFDESKLATLSLGEFTPDEIDLVAHIYDGLDIDQAYPAAFGEVAEISDMGEILAASTATIMQETIGTLHKALNDANPENVIKGRSRLARWTGAAIEVEMRYRAACTRISTLVDGARQRIADSDAFVHRLDGLRQAHVLAIRHLRVHLAAGRLYTAGYVPPPPVAGELGGSAAKDRFTRRLSNIAVMLHSTQMALAQIDMVKAQVKSQIERLGQAVEVLLTVWRNHAFSVLASSVDAPELTNSYKLALSHLKGIN